MVLSLGIKSVDLDSMRGCKLCAWEKAKAHKIERFKETDNCQVVCFEDFNRDMLIIKAYLYSIAEALGSVSLVGSELNSKNITSYG